jgi:hypothetical protein
VIWIVQILAFGLGIEGFHPDLFVLFFCVSGFQLGLLCIPFNKLQNRVDYQPLKGDDSAPSPPGGTW